jgi:hypothetical protein
VPSDASCMTTVGALVTLGELLFLWQREQFTHPALSTVVMHNTYWRRCGRGVQPQLVFAHVRRSCGPVAWVWVLAETAHRRGARAACSRASSTMCMSRRCSATRTVCRPPSALSGAMGSVAAAAATEGVGRTQTHSREGS